MSAVVTWVDDSTPERIAHPEVAMQDVRESHAWATQELVTAAPGSIRQYCLTQERNRLAGIAWRLKGGFPSTVRPHPWEDRRADYLRRKA